MWFLCSFFIYSPLLDGFQRRIEFHVLLLASVNVFTSAFTIMSSELLISCIMGLDDDGGNTKLKGVLIVYFCIKYLFFECVLSALFCECALLTPTFQAPFRTP